MTLDVLYIVRMMRLERSREQETESREQETDSSELIELDVSGEDMAGRETRLELTDGDRVSGGSTEVAVEVEEEVVVMGLIIFFLLVPVVGLIEIVVVGKKEVVEVVPSVEQKSKEQNRLWWILSTRRNTQLSVL